MQKPTIGVLTSIGQTLDAFFPHLIQRWNHEGHRVYAAAGTPALDSESTVIAGLTREPQIRNLSAVNRLKEWVAENAIDVVLTNTATASAIARLLPVGAPVVYFCHGLHWDRPTLSNAPFRAAEWVLLRRTHGVVTLNSDDERWFKRHAGQIPQIRLPYGVGLAPSEYVRSDIRPVQPPHLVWIGEFTARKDPLSAVSIAQRLAATGLDFQLTMLGEGAHLPQILQRVRDAGIEKVVSLPGRIPAAPVLENATAVIHTAQWEGLPRVLLEAVSIGRPVYAFDAKGVRDIPGARLFSDRNDEALAKSLASDLLDVSGMRARVASYPPPEALSSDRSAILLSRFLTENFGRKA